MSERDALRVAALVAVARAYGLSPRATNERQFGARCPACYGSGGRRHLVIAATPTGTLFECTRCGVSGSGLEELQRLAEGSFPLRLTPLRTAALARLDALIANRGDVAREACDRIADALETAESEPNTLTPRARAHLAPVPSVQAANDDREAGEGRA